MHHPPGWNCARRRGCRCAPIFRSAIRSISVAVQTFGSAQDFLRSQRPDAPACLVLDVRLTGQSGLDFQRTLAEHGIDRSVVSISGHGDVSSQAPGIVGPGCRTPVQQRLEVQLPVIGLCRPLATASRSKPGSVGR